MAGMNEKTKLAILRVLRDANSPMGSGAIARSLKAFGIDTLPRTLRSYLEQLQDDALVTPASRGRGGGRSLTQRGLDELECSSVLDRVGMTAVKVNTMACRMNFNSRTEEGDIVLNISSIDNIHFRKAAQKMIEVFEAGFSMGEYLAIFKAGDRIGRIEVPRGKVMIGTVCSVTVNGIFLKHGIPTTSKFGGVLELNQGVPVRFTDIIYYEGSSLDPLEIFIKSGLTSVSEASATGDGRIGVSFREIPTVALDQARNLMADLCALKLDGIVSLGTPNQPLLEFPVHEGVTPFIVTGGMNPISAVEEVGIPTKNVALSHLYPFKDLIHYRDLKEDLGIEGRTLRRRKTLEF